MTSKDSAESSALTAAAEALEEQLKKFEAASESLRKTPLNSQKNLERAARALHEIANLDEALGVHVRTLVSAISSARDRQQSQAQSVQARAEELRLRTETYQDLLKQIGALGENASSLNAMMLKLSNSNEETSSAGFEALFSRMDEVVASAQTLTEAADAKDFGDVARQADSLRQQLLAARNKLNLLHKKMGEA